MIRRLMAPDTWSEGSLGNDPLSARVAVKAETSGLGPGIADFAISQSLRGTGIALMAFSLITSNSRRSVGRGCSHDGSSEWP